ncbi:MAG TPA: hypothetical protein VFM69_07290 [Pricia sp.]|nr:hypothetical protein [Pricia sp.]
MIFSRIACLFLLGFLIVSCSDDDNGPPPPPPPRPLDEVAVEDAAKIEAYLKTHFYNYEQIDTLPENADFSINLDTIAGDNSDKIPLIQHMQAETVTVSSEELGLPEGGNRELTYYYLEVRKGKGGSPTVADSTFFKYEGRTLDNALFDASDAFNWRYLPNFLRGFSIGISKLNAGDNIVVNPDGTTSIENTGIGMVIFPSGLGYYNTARPGIPAYSPLIFKLELGLYTENTDFDKDGVPSHMEDVNGDGNLNNDNTDGDFARTQTGNRPIFNHEDTNDDNDDTPTREEIELDDDGNLILPLPDSDSDGIPDYLDADS